VSSAVGQRGWSAQSKTHWVTAAVMMPLRHCWYSLGSISRLLSSSKGRSHPTGDSHDKTHFLRVEQEIIAKIKDRAIEPQVVVSLVTQNTSLITVLGEVNNATTASPTGRLPAQPAGERLLDVITRAGGLRDQGQDTWVVLERHGHRAAVPFGSLIYEPGNNIWAWPDDTIYLYKEPQTYIAFGASGQQGNFQSLSFWLTEGVCRMPSRPCFGFCKSLAP
jgi:hypothetical protein